MWENKVCYRLQPIIQSYNCGFFSFLTTDNKRAAKFVYLISAVPPLPCPSPLSMPFASHFQLILLFICFLLTAPCSPQPSGQVLSPLQSILHKFVRAVFSQHIFTSNSIIAPAQVFHSFSSMKSQVQIHHLHIQGQLHHNFNYLFFSVLNLFFYL